MTLCNEELIPVFNQLEELAYKHRFMDEKSEIWKETDKMLASTYKEAVRIFNKYTDPQHKKGACL